MLNQGTTSNSKWVIAATYFNDINIIQVTLFTSKRPKLSLMLDMMEHMYRSLHTQNITFEGSFEQYL